MALEGQLSDFSLEEILQLIAVQQKSGFLVLKHDQEMVFYFDHGTLISVRDRRAPGNDPFAPFLRRYGYLRDEQWTHLDYVLSHASLDLAEILLSEHIMDEATLLSTLQALAQEMIHHGMQIKSGSYHFTATNEVSTGIRGRLDMDIQGLLMEGARRLDEEPRLAAALPSLAMSFERGEKTAEPGELSETRARVLKLALAGKTLGEIIASARAVEFTTRELLKDLCETGLLVAVKAEMAEIVQLPADRRAAGGRRVALRQPVLTVACALLLLAVGALRWWPVLAGTAEDDRAAVGTAAVGAAAGTDLGAVVAGTSPSAVALDAPDIRLRQLADDVDQAVRLYRLANGRCPDDLATLVREGSLPAQAAATLERAGWTYHIADRGRSYTLGH